MNISFKIIGIILIAVLFSSCEKTIDFKGDEIEPKIVVNGLLVAGTKVSANIFQSRSLLSEKGYFESLKDAKADLYVDGEFVETLKYESKIDTFRKRLDHNLSENIPYENGIYTSETLVEPGRTYKLEVSREGVNSVNCETTVPEPVEIISVDTLTEVVEKDWGTTQFFTILMKFKDPGDRKNYYRVQVNNERGSALNYYYSDQIVYTDTILVSKGQGIGFYLNDPIFKNSESEANDIVLGAPDNQYAIFDDSQISGREYTLKAQFSNYISNVSDIEHGDFLIQQPILYSITKDYFDYLNTVNYHFWFQDDYFSEPVPVYTNVNGGLGIWSSAGVSQYSITIGNYPMPGKTYVDADEYYQYGAGGYSPY